MQRLQQVSRTAGLSRSAGLRSSSGLVIVAGRGTGSFTDLVGCQLPLQLASLGGPVGTPSLAVAVSEAGGLGMIPNPSSALEVEQLVERARALTTRPLGVGFLIPFVSREAVDAASKTA